MCLSCIDNSTSCEKNFTGSSHFHSCFSSGCGFFSQSVEVFMQTPPGERNSTSCENLSPDTSQFHSCFSFGCVFLPSVEVLMQMPPGGRVTNIDKRCVLL